MRFGSLFAGIGGMDLGLERAGMECAWQVEIDPFCRKVLAKHWPDVPKYEDVRDVGAHNLESVDLICGGFPCQDISNSGAKAGITGARSGLWREYARIIREIRPQFVVVENVAALRFRGLGDVLGDLAAFGYDAEWDVLPACAFGAPQRRERLFVVAYHDGRGSERDAEWNCFNKKALGRAHVDGLVLAEGRAEDAGARLRGMGHALPSRVDRVRALGNAVVPQVAEWIGRRIMEAV